MRDLAEAKVGHRAFMSNVRAALALHGGESFHRVYVRATIVSHLGPLRVLAVMLAGPTL